MPIIKPKHQHVTGNTDFHKHAVTSKKDQSLNDNSVGIQPDSSIRIKQLPWSVHYQKATQSTRSDIPAQHLLHQYAHSSSKAQQNNAILLAQVNVTITLLVQQLHLLFIAYYKPVSSNMFSWVKNLKCTVNNSRMPFSCACVKPSTWGQSLWCTKSAYKMLVLILPLDTWSAVEIPYLQALFMCPPTAKTLNLYRTKWHKPIMPSYRTHPIFL